MTLELIARLDLKYISTVFSFFLFRTGMITSLQGYPNLLGDLIVSIQKHSLTFLPPQDPSHRPN